MSQQRVDQLYALGFKWSISCSPQKAWDDRIEELKEFEKDNGHFNVPHGYGPLRAFVQNQRAMYKLRRAENPS